MERQTHWGPISVRYLSIYNQFLIVVTYWLWDTSLPIHCVWGLVCRNYNSPLKSNVTFGLFSDDKLLGLLTYFLISRLRYLFLVAYTRLNKLLRWSFPWFVQLSGRLSCCWSFRPKLSRTHHSPAHPYVTLFQWGILRGNVVPTIRHCIRPCLFFKLPFWFHFRPVHWGRVHWAVLF